MPTPITSKARVLFYPPTSQPRTEYGGHPYAHEYAFAEMGRGRPPSAGSPPDQQQAFWRHAAVNGLEVVPEVRGAVFTSSRLAWAVPDDVWCFTAAGAAGRWRSDTWPTEPWQQVWQEGLRAFAAFSTNPAGGYLQVPQLPAASSWFVRYVLLAPEGTSATPPPRAGLTLYWGVSGDPYPTGATILNRIAGKPRLDLPLPGEASAEDASWSFWAGTSLIDTRPATGSAQRDVASPDLRWQTVEVLCLAGRILVRTDGDTWTVGGDDFRDGLPEGGMALRVYGTRALIQAGVVGYGLQADLRGPDIHTPDWANFPATDAEFAGHLVTEPPVALPSSHTTPWRVLDANQRLGRVQMTVQNPGAAVPGRPTHRLTSPVLLRAIVQHPPRYAPVSGQPVDVSCAVEELSYTLLASGRGHSASLSLDLDTEGLFPQDLVGACLVTIDLAHQYSGEVIDPDWDPADGEAPMVPTPDGDWQRVFTGHVRRRQLVLSEGERRLRFELQDRTLLWQAPRTAAQYMPSWSGLRLDHALAIALEHGHCRPTDELWFANLPYAQSVTVPSEGGATPALMASGADLIEVLDRLCELTYHRWSILPDGRVWVDVVPTAVGPSVYTITDNDDVQEVDKPDTGLEAPFDVSDTNTVVIVEGRDRWGRGLSLLRRDAQAIGQPTADRYVGYELWARYSEPDNPRPEAIMARHWARSQSRGVSVAWSMLGRGLVPGQTVDTTLPDLRLSPSEALVIATVSGRLSAADDPPLWREEYEADLVAGGFHGW